MYLSFQLKKKKRGIDFVAYRGKIFLNLLYLFYEKVQDKHLDRKVWLIKDNFSSYIKAAKIYVDIIKKKRLKKWNSWLTPQIYIILKISKIVK